jgi:hypothetical protein
MNNQAIEFLQNTFTSGHAPQFSNNPDKIDVFSIHRGSFLNFIKEQESAFMCNLIDMSSRTNNRRGKNEEYLASSQVVVSPRSEIAGRPSPLFSAVS